MSYRLQKPPGASPGFIASDVGQKLIPASSMNDLVL